jgi:hypothetical protein
MEDEMERISKEEAFESGRRACLNGLPSTPALNAAFWDRTVMLDGHDYWKSMLKAYVEGWYSVKEKVHI